jgi:hypothetical protein
MIGFGAASHVPHWPPGTAQAEIKAIIAKRKDTIGAGKFDGPASSVLAKPMPKVESRGFGGQTQDRPYATINIPPGGRIRNPQDLPNPFAAPSLSIPAIHTTRKKFALTSTAKEVRVASTRAIDFGSTFVLLHIGLPPTRQTFAVDENILAQRPQQFADHLCSLPPEHGFKPIDLPDLDPQAFALYVQFLYTSHMPTRSAPKPPTNVRPCVNSTSSCTNSRTCSLKTSSSMLCWL